MPTDDSKRGVYGKYILAKADGSDIDPDACYFILRLDTDVAARAAARTYAEECGNKSLADDILACLEQLEQPLCGCREAGCSHTPILSATWSARQRAEDIGGMSEYPRRMRMWMKEAEARHNAD